MRDITDEEMALPGPKPTEEQIEKWLAKPDYGFIPGDKALQMLKKGLEDYRKRKAER